MDTHRSNRETHRERERETKLNCVCVLCAQIHRRKNYYRKRSTESGIEVIVARVDHRLSLRAVRYLTLHHTSEAVVCVCVCFCICIVTGQLCAHSQQRWLITMSLSLSSCLLAFLLSLSLMYVRITIPNTTSATNKPPANNNSTAGRHNSPAGSIIIIIFFINWSNNSITILVVVVVVVYSLLPIGRSYQSAHLLWFVRQRVCICDSNSDRMQMKMQSVKLWWCAFVLANTQCTHAHIL